MSSIRHGRGVDVRQLWGELNVFIVLTIASVLAVLLGLYALTPWTGLAHPRVYSVACFGAALWCYAERINGLGHLTYVGNAILLIGVTVTASAGFIVCYRAAYPWWEIPRWLVASMIAEPLAVALVAAIGGADGWHRIIEYNVDGMTHYRAGYFVQALYGLSMLLWLIVTSLRYSEHAQGRQRWTFRAIGYVGLFAIAAQISGFLSLVALSGFALLLIVGIAVRTSDQEFAGITGKGERASDIARRLGGLARHRDALTGALTRGALDLLLDSEVVVAARTTKPLSLLIIDADNFKPVNDKLGHLAGDEILVAIAERAMNVVGSAGHVGRFGGDEFVVVLPGVGTDEAVSIGAHIVSAVHREVHTDAGQITPSVSVGVATYRGGGVRDLLAAADQQMYLAKKKGGNRTSATDTQFNRRSTD